ncbi:MULTISPECIES: hypothetical protein [Streptomyces]|uniref:Transcriptional regulator n=1 Tax=Streptomyces kasugaensis TaxID=1946 RepID=A0A4Q9I0U9_STRKA|nr:hypothetical protein [Streptomyces kasugaensis]TBO61298.1 hypothetical protein EYS09_02050 [Streptomyces kasugaensis]
MGSARGAGETNTALAAVILETGRSHAALARKVNELAALQGVVTRYDKASVTRWLQGMTPRDRAPEFIAAALADFLGRPLTPVDLGFSEQPQRPVVARALAYREDVGETLHTLAELGSTDISRRSLLGAVPYIATALMDPQRQWLLWLLEAEQTPRLEVVAGSGPVQQVQAMIEMFDEMDNRFGGAGVRASIVHYLSTELTPMLQQRNLPTHQRRLLYTSAAKLAAMAGWCSYDSADYGLAERYMIQALRLCAEGGDRVLGGQILAGMSHLATSLGNPAEGVSLARAGIATAKSAGSPLGLMRLHAMAARSYAILGDSRQATASLLAAGKRLDVSQGPAEESPWVRFLDHHYLEAEAALVHRDLGEAAQAERLAMASVEANSDRRRRQAISRSVLATAFLQQNRLDEAVGTASNAVDLLAGVHSERSVQALRDFRARLAPHRGEAIVRDFERKARPILGTAA